MKKIKQPIPSKPYTALALRRNPEGKNWSLVTFTIQDGKVIKESLSKYDLLPYTMSKASALLQDMVKEIR